MDEFELFLFLRKWIFWETFCKYVLPSVFLKFVFFENCRLALIRFTVFYDKSNEPFRKKIQIIQLSPVKLKAWGAHFSRPIFGAGIALPFFNGLEKSVSVEVYFLSCFTDEINNFGTRVLKYY